MPDVPVTALGPLPLIIQPVFFDEADRADADCLALDLYSYITRDRHDPMAHGPGVPVLKPMLVDVGCDVDDVDFEQAHKIVVLPVFGRRLHRALHSRITRRLKCWGQRHPAKLRMCVIRSNGSEHAIAIAPQGQVADIYSGHALQPAALQRIVTTVARAFVASPAAPPQVRVSYAPHDKMSQHAATRVHQALSRQEILSPLFKVLPLNAPFDPQHSRPPCEELLIVVMGDTYATSNHCVEQMLAAKRADHPVLAVTAFERNEVRGSSIAGNVPTLLWRDNAESITLRALTLWIQANLFRAESERVLQALHAPRPRFMSRPPEVLDVVNAEEPPSRLLMYPDPQLSLAERRMLSQAHHQLHLLTPTTAYGYLVRESDKHERSGPLQTPLDGLKVGMSVSSAGLLTSLEQVSGCHQQDMIVRCARTLIAAGAKLGYGGMRRKSGYTEILVELVKAHTLGSTGEHARLLSFLDAREKDDDKALWGDYLNVHYMATEPTAVLNAPGDSPALAPALYFSDMRRYMSAQLDAAVLIGGADEPRCANQDSGYIGRYPGVAEEVWRMMQLGKPVYIAGGFGGEAALLAQIIKARDNNTAVPEKLRDSTWEQCEGFDEQIKPFDADQYYDKLGLPTSADALCSDLREAARKHLATDASALAWNGLGVLDNLTLLDATDPSTIVSLIYRGLCRVAEDRRVRQKQLSIELVYGDVLNTSALSALSVPVVSGVPIGGAARAVNDIVGDRIQEAHDHARQLIGLQGGKLAADFVHLAQIQHVQNPGDDHREFPFDIKPAVKDACDTARRSGFTRLGVVTYGASFIASGPKSDSQFRSLVEIMVAEFREHLPRSVTLVWHELDAKRFDIIEQYLRNQKDIQLPDVLDVSPSYHHVPPTRCFGLEVNLLDADTCLEVTVAPPSGTALSPLWRKTIKPREVDEFAKGIGEKKISTPKLADALERGERLLDWLVGPAQVPLFSDMGTTELCVTHNTRASRLPFELLSHAGEPILSVTRRLKLDRSNREVNWGEHRQRPILKVLLVVDPRNNLPAARQEGLAVKHFLDRLPHVLTEMLPGPEATLEAVAKRMSNVDVFHYCGHGYFHKPGGTGSGIELANKELLRPENLPQLGVLPSVAIFNACRVANMQYWKSQPGATFAGYWLQSGIKSFVGTTWAVDDAGASQFAQTLYQALSNGHELRDAVRLGRQALYDSAHNDWCNFVLYGAGSFRLLERTGS